MLVPIVCLFKHFYTIKILFIIFHRIEKIIQFSFEFFMLIK